MTISCSPTWIWLTSSEGPELPANKSHVVVFEGEMVSEFVDTAILKQRAPICQLKSGNCAVYDLPDTAFLVVVSLEKNLHLFSPITELLAPFIGATAQRITTLTVLSGAQHKRIEKDRDSSRDDPICYLRSLNGTVKGIETLEAPNMISGVAAGVSVWRQFNDLPPVNNYVAYMEAVVYDSASTRPLLDLLRRLDVPCADSFTRRFKVESNLYL